MRLLLDEMFPSSATIALRELGHDAVDVRELGLLGSSDLEVLQRAIDDDRVVVTENMRDFAPLVDVRTTAGQSVVPVVFALKRSLPAGAGAMGRALAERLDRWSGKNPEPYRHVHWLE